MPAKYAPHGLNVWTIAMKLTNEDVFEAGTGTFWDVNVCVPLTVVRTGAKLEPGEDEDKRELAIELGETTAPGTGGSIGCDPGATEASLEAGRIGAENCTPGVFNSVLNESTIAVYLGSGATNVSIFLL